MSSFLIMWYMFTIYFVFKLMFYWSIVALGFPGSSADKESACNAGDPSSIPGSRKSAKEAIGHPLQYSWPSLVTQLVKNPPAMLETWVRSLGWEDPLERGKATHSSILAWRIPWTVSSMGSQRVRHDWATFTFSLEATVSLISQFSNTSFVFAWHLWEPHWLHFFTLLETQVHIYTC